MDHFLDPNEKNKLSLKEEQDLLDACAEAEYGISYDDSDMYEMEFLD